MSDEPDFADSLEAQLIADYVSGGMPLTRACAALGKDRQFAYRAMDKSPRFTDMMEKARLAGYDELALECLDIADDDSEDWEERTNQRTGATYLAPNKEFTQRSKLRVETRLKLLAKWHPKKYGEKLQVETKGATVAMPVGDDPIAAQRAYEELMKGS